MEEKNKYIRNILSVNIKKNREKLGFSQEKLAENAGISTMMIKDIEGCRTWVSDKTLLSLSSALKTDIYRLFMPETPLEEEICKIVQNDLEIISQKILIDIDNTLKKTIKSWNIKKKNQNKA